MKKEKLITYFVLIGIILALPSVVFLAKNLGSIVGYSGQFYYNIAENSSFFTKTGALIYIWSLILMFVIYLLLIKKSDQFSNIRSILFYSAIIGLAFVICLPNTSKDVFFYMANGRAIDKYGINTYKTSIAEMENIDYTDNVIKMAGSQSKYVFVYGPLFLTICGLLNKISLSSVSLFLYEFKILNFIAYLFTTYLIYKVTKKKKLTIAFAFNPLIIFETLVNVHNDIFVVLFAFLGILFLKETEKYKDKFWKSEIMFLCCLTFIVFSSCIKYILIIILPFIILYHLRNERLFKKFIYGNVYLLIFLGIFLLMYMPYFDNPINVFTGAFIQNSKLKDSIYLVITMIFEGDSQIVSIAYSIGFFVFLYIFIIKILMQLLRENTFKTMMNNFYAVLLGLIFLFITNLTSWYLIWLFIPVFWTNGRRLKNLIWLRLFIRNYICNFLSDTFR